jgi:hypothetical protein
MTLYTLDYAVRNAIHHHSHLLWIHKDSILEHKAPYQKAYLTVKSKGRN